MWHLVCLPDLKSVNETKRETAGLYPVHW